MCQQSKRNEIDILTNNMYDRGSKKAYTFKRGFKHILVPTPVGYHIWDYLKYTNILIDHESVSESVILKKEIENHVN